MTEFKAYGARLTANARWVGNQIKKQFDNAGATYNAGNWFALGAVACQLFVNAHGNTAETVQALTNYFAGSISSIAASLGSAAFFYGGRKYEKAWQNGFPPDTRENNLGHIGSAIGAAFLMASVVGLSRSPLALITGIAGGSLHTGGKLGSLADPKRDAFYKWLPLLSRVPAIVSLTDDIRENLVRHPHLLEAAQNSLLPASLIVCNVIWGRADAMLMPEGRTKRVLSKALLIEPMRN